jgi:hypothetical protein
MPARRGTGRRLQRFNALILARDPICVVDGCNRRSVEVDHDPPLLERPDGASPYDPSTAFGKCKQHHLEATRALRLRHGLPYAPGSRELEHRSGKAGVPPRGKNMIWEGAISLPVTGPCKVVRRGGEVIDVPAGVTLPADERKW